MYYYYHDTHVALYLIRAKPKKDVSNLCKEMHFGEISNTLRSLVCMYIFKTVGLVNPMVSKQIVYFRYSDTWQIPVKEERMNHEEYSFSPQAHRVAMAPSTFALTAVSIWV